MNINEMSGQEKSVLLAKAMGLEIEPHFAHPHDIFIKIPPEWDYEWELLEGDFYTAPMGIAWRVLNWANEQHAPDPREEYIADDIQEYMRFYGPWLSILPPEEAQKNILDQILTLAIEAGLVEVEHD